MNKYPYSSFTFVDGTKTKSVLTPFNKPSSETVDKVFTGDDTYKTQETKYEYDKRNRCIKENVTVKYFNSSAVCEQTEYYAVNYFYNTTNDALVKKVTHVGHDSGGSRSEEFSAAEEYVYDSYGNITTTKKYRLETEHSAEGNCICDSSATIGIFYTEQNFDGLGRLKQELDPTGKHLTKYNYFSRKNLVSNITYPDGGIESFAYDSENRVTSLSTTLDGLENKNDTQYTSGEVTKYNHSGNNAVEYAYDNKRRISSISIGGSLYESYSYAEKVAESGYTVDKVTITNAKNEKFTATTDRKGSFDKIYYNDTLILQNSYNAKGELTKTEDKLSGEVKTYTYNKVGALKEYALTKSGSSYKESAVYDVKGRLQEITYTGTVSRTDVFRHSESAVENIQQITTGDYVIKPNQDIYQRYTGKEVLISGIKVDYEEIAYLKETDHLTNLPKEITYKNDYLTYKYDSNGNITHIYRDGTLEARYEYDTANRLIREDNRAFSKSYFYSYDSNGNIITREENIFTISDNYTLGTGAVTSISYTKDRMTSFSGLSCSYDAVGNPTQYCGWMLTWTRGRKLIKYGPSTFEYNAQGQRTKKNGITYTYDSQGRILKQSNGLEFFYDTTGIVGIKYYSVNYVYRKDVQGNIIAILDSSGNVVVKYHYDAWGNHTITDSNGKSVTNGIGVSNPFRYRGYYYDTETKLYFLQTRYYDPEVGRFINIDNIDYIDPETINGLNLYAYCNNNPVNYYDPSGQFVISIGAGVGLGIAAAGAALLAWIEATFHPIENAVKDIGELIGNSINNSTDTTINIVPKPQISHPAFPSGSNGKQIDLINIATLISIINNIFLSRERNRGRDSGFIGISDEELEKLLLEAKRNHDSYMIQRILKEMKMRGMRNTRKQRGGPNMRGILLMFLLGGGLLSKFHENTN